MNDTLVYDAATMSTAPQHAALLAAGLAVVAALLLLWQRLRAGRGFGLGHFFGIGAVIIAAVAGGLQWELKAITARPTLQVEGPVTGLWQRSTRRGSRERDGYWDWQGFSVDGAAFAYVRNVEQNSFNNAGPQSLELHDGLPLRLRYVETVDDGQVQRHIVRVERLGVWPR